MQPIPRIVTVLSLASLCACATELVPGKGDFTKGEDGKSDTSAEAIFLDFEFDGSLQTSLTFNAEKTIEDQLLYTIGQLNHYNSVGRLDRLELTNVEIVDEGTHKTINYHARMPVAWGRKNSVPSAHTLVLPKDMRFSALNSFAEAYGHDCVDFGAHDVDRGSMWYYFRPERSGCNIDSEELVETVAAVSISDINTTGKYPEYHKVWEDETLKVVAIFGKYEDGATTSSDAGIAAYNNFARKIDDTLEDKLGYQTEPADIPFSPGVDMPELSYRADLGDGRSIEVVSLLVDNVRTAPFSFDQRYEELSADADLIIYNGHAGLGANIRSLASKGHWVQGQYAMVFMNGCDTYAYIDDSLAKAHAAVNPDDPNGTKYLDIVTNAMPSFFHSMPNASMALINGLLSYDEPRTYETMFRDIDRKEVVLVSGEQDNEFVPGGGGQPEEWDGMSESGSIVSDEEHHFETPVLDSGSYEFALKGTGDADLYVRLGSVPSQNSYDCRPYLDGSSEICRVDINTPTKVFVMVRGWDASSDYSLTGN